MHDGVRLSEAPYTPTPAYDWVGVLLDITGAEVDRNGARPTIISRIVYVTVASMFQAWAAYDDAAVGTEFGGAFRRPLAERTPENRAIAVSYAAYRAMLNVYPQDAAALRAAMERRGLDPDAGTTDPSTAEIGRAHV